MTLKLFLSAVLAGMLSLGAAQASSYPSKPVRLVVGFPPGQTTDIIARLLANALSTELGQSFFVDNKPGVGATIGAREVINAKPDGYTLLVSSSGPLAVSSHIYKNIQYDPRVDLEPIAFIGAFPLVMVTPANSSHTTLQDLLKADKPGAPSTVMYASGGNGVTNHLAMELFKSAANLQWTHVPYRGGVQALTDLVGGQTDVMFEVVSIVLPFVQNGKVRALAVASEERLKPLPDVPTVAESGFKGFNVDPWIGFLGPKNLPDDVLETLSAAVRKVTSTEQWRNEMEKIGAVPREMSRQEFGTFIRTEYDKWGDAVEKAKVEAQ